MLGQTGNRRHSTQFLPIKESEEEGGTVVLLGQPQLVSSRESSYHVAESPHIVSRIS